MHPRLSRQLQVLVDVEPLRIVGGEDVGLDPVRRKVRRKLERTLDSAAARRREVHRHQKDLHALRW